MAQPTFISAVNLTPGTSASPGAQAVTVPSDATHAVVHWSAFMDGVNPGQLTGLTSNFGTFTRQQFNGAAVAPNYWNNTGTAWAAVTATGSRTLTPTWTTGPFVEPVFMVSFWKDVDSGSPVLDQDAISEDDESTLASVVVNSTADSAVIALDAAPLGSPPSNPTGWTSRLTMTSGDGHSGRLRTANSPGASTTTAQGVTAFYSSMSAISLQGSSGGGTQTLLPSLLTRSKTIYAPTVTPGAVAVSPPLLTRSKTIYAPTVTSTLTLLPPLVTRSKTLYAPTVVPGSITLEPPLLTRSKTIYAPTVSQDGGDAQTLFPPLLTRNKTLYAPIVVPGEVTLSPPLVTRIKTLYAPTVTSAVTLLPPLLTRSKTIYAPTVAVGSVTLFPPLLTRNKIILFPTVTGGDPAVATGGLFLPIVRRRRR